MRSRGSVLRTKKDSPAAAAAAPGGAEAENPLASLAPTQLTAVQQYISKLLGNLGAAGAAAVRR